MYDAESKRSKEVLMVLPFNLINWLEGTSWYFHCAPKSPLLATSYIIGLSLGSADIFGFMQPWPLDLGSANILKIGTCSNPCLREVKVRRDVLPER